MIDYSYDELGRQTETIINQTLRYRKDYDGYSRLLQIEDILRNQKIKYEYDIIGRLVSERLIDTLTNQIDAQFDIRYDDTKNRVTGYDVNLEGITNATDYTYGENNVAPDIITSIKLNGSKLLAYGYDGLNRLTTRTLSTTTPFVTEYGYLQGATADKTTALVESVKNGSDTLEYTYDVLGNITSVSKNGSLIESYTYDNLNQLKAVTRGTDVYEYTYDNGGNILSVTKNGETVKTYTYGDSEWKDMLTAYNGESITYDNIGNPLTYRDGMTLTWTDGRKLSSITKGTDSISYTYDANGLRTSKTVNGTTTEYYWLNGMLQGQKTGSEYILFLYDENGVAYGFIVQNGTEKSYYYYEFNLQSDIIGIIDSTGNRVVEYKYNEWGKILDITGTLADTIGQKNPLRYRGYYYDAETGFYYLNSRYYDPETGRFLNADSAIAGIGGNINGYNLYSYCFNNPVNLNDPTGNWPFNAIGKIIAKTVCTIIVTTVINHIVNAINKKKIDKEVKESYDKETAKEEIDEILEQYGDDVNATFNDEGVEIENSIKVNSRYDRQKISTIITRTESVTSREYDDLSAEWLFHNIAYDLHIKRESAISANLDYVSDSRWYVVGATDLLEIFGWE